ncbi:MAG: excinuclease ABC subunit UvrC [Steroidobacteraceae bacterium]|nr:excinuclease ABC subunit UvrC [Steroidobacteraceae bacterium]
MSGDFDARAFVATLPRRPGVYRMYGAGGELLYVGKAQRLRDRVGSYFSPRNLAPKVAALVAQIVRVEVTVTNSDTEAVLLEYNLIKEHRPRYNILLRDDKSFPYILLRTNHDFPRFLFYRGARQRDGRYFGPFPSASSVHEMLTQIQKLFRIRNCRDSFFANRSRPCLQYQIGRCTAPCVGLISREDYARDVAAAVELLEGRGSGIEKQLTERMEAAATALEYEKAAQLRDQLAVLRDIQASQVVTSANRRDADVFAIVGEPTEFAVSTMLVRGGRNLGTSTAFPAAGLAEPGEALSSYLMQYYALTAPPREVYVNLALPDAGALASVLGERASRQVQVSRPARGLAARWAALTVENATQALRMRRAQRDGVADMRVALAAALDLPAPPERMECFDISHTAGEGTVASCVVFGPDGPLKSEYRRFNIADVTPGDDYGALRQALARRYARIRDGELPPPDVLFIDGGRGQVGEVHDVLAEQGFADLVLVGVAKGADRRPGQERLFVYGESTPRVLEPTSPALRLIQRIRDEAHRFAITGHRKRRARRYHESILETVPGLGPARRRALLRHFGGLQGVLKAGVADLERVAGIGPALAQTLYDHLHPGA